MPDQPSVSLPPSPGILGERDLLDLLRFLYRTQATVLILVEADGAKAEVHVRQGGIRAAFFNDQQGPAAVTRVMLLPRATYRFAELPLGVARNIQHETSFLLDSIARVVTDAEVNRTDTSRARPATSGATTTNQGRFVPAAGEPQIGDRFGRCRLVREVGRGASGLVFLARHESLDLDVAIKVLLQDGDGPQHRRLTMNEARLLARLTHPGIVRLYDFDDSARLPYLVMEFVEGRSLSELLHSVGRMTASRALPIFCEVLSALAYAQDEVGLVHGDLKPENILLTDGGQAKLLDFGVARAIGNAGLSVDNGAVVGSPSYIAPEQVEQKPFDHRADLYALGATLYHALTGAPPFTDADPIQRMIRRLSESARPPHEVVPSIDLRLSETVMRLIARDPADRPATHGEALDQLSEALDRRRETDGDDRGVIRRRTSFWLRVPKRVLGR